MRRWARRTRAIQLRATLAGVKTLIQNETSSLLNASATNPAVTICENLNGTAVAYPPTEPSNGLYRDTSPPAADPETITGATGASAIYQRSH